MKFPAYVLIPFLAGLLFGRHTCANSSQNGSLNPLFGGSAFRTVTLNNLGVSAVLIPFLAGLLFGLTSVRIRPIS